MRLQRAAVPVLDVIAAQVPPLLPPMDVTAAAHVPPLPDVTAAQVPPLLLVPTEETPREKKLRKGREWAKRHYCPHFKQRSKCEVCSEDRQRKAAALSADSPTM